MCIIHLKTHTYTYHIKVYETDQRKLTNYLRMVKCSTTEFLISFDIDELKKKFGFGLSSFLINWIYFLKKRSISKLLLLKVFEINV